MAQEKSEFLRGMLDMLILKIVALDPSHGYAIAQLWYAKIPSGSHLTEMLALICSAFLR